MASHLHQGRGYNGLTGLEVRTVIMKQLADELLAQDDPAPELQWRKQAAGEIDRQFGLDDRFRPHIAYPVIEWGWSFEGAARADTQSMIWVFTLKVKAYPVETSEWVVTFKGGAKAPVDPEHQKETPAVIDFDVSASYGQGYEPPDKLRKETGLPVPRPKSAEGGKVDLTGADIDLQQRVGRDTIDSL